MTDSDELSEMWSNEADAQDNSDAEDEKNTTETMDATHTEHAMDAQDTQQATEWDVDSIREAWQPNNVRLPESIQDVFASEYKRLDYELDQSDTDFGFTKDRYYKPLVVALGLETLQAMDADEVADRVDAMEQAELLDE